MMRMRRREVEKERLLEREIYIDRKVSREIYVGRVRGMRKRRRGYKRGRYI